MVLKVMSNIWPKLKSKCNIHTLTSKELINVFFEFFYKFHLNRSCRYCPFSQEDPFPWSVKTVSLKMFGTEPGMTRRLKIIPSHIIKPMTKSFIVRWESKSNKKNPFIFYFLSFIYLWNVKPFLFEVWLLQYFAGHCGILNHINVWKNATKLLTGDTFG